MAQQRSSAEQQIHDRLAQIPEIQRAWAVVAVVSDPYSSTGGRISVLRQTRDDPLAGMLARGFIDQTQHDAGRTWQQHWEDAQPGAVRAIDPTQEPVDGSSPRPGLYTERRAYALKELRLITIVLGWEGDRIVRAVLAERLQLIEVAERHNRSKKYMGQRFRECLETMARTWFGVAPPKDEQPGFAQP